MKKYKRPWTHSLAQDSLIEDLLVEYWEDYFDEFPEEARKALSKDGELIFESTGDPLLDKWETEFAKGLTPDLEEGLSPEERDKLQRERVRAQAARRHAAALGNTDEDYSKIPGVLGSDRHLDSKFVTPGSKEEATLRHRRTLGRNNRKLATLAAGLDDWEDLLKDS